MLLIVTRNASQSVAFIAEELRMISSTLIF
jgi:hypothetical protein